MNTRAWNWMIFRGIFGVIFGILAFMWPITALVAVTALFAIYVLVAGGMSLAAAYEQSRTHHSWGILAFQGIVAILAGLVSIMYPGIALFSLILLIAVWALISGVSEITFAYVDRKKIDHPAWLAVAGVVSILFGVALVAWPLNGLTFLVAFIGAYALINGAFLIAWGVRRKNRATDNRSAPLRPAYR